MALRLDGVGFEYAPGTTYAEDALSGISLDVECGEMVLVLGATGSGKSTLLRIAAGLLEPSSGTATIDDSSLVSSTARGVVGLVFQDAESQLFAETIASDVAFGPNNLGVIASEVEVRVRDALVAVGLDPARYASRSPFGLSGGEARRAAIAGVLSMRPRYLLLDEPTAGLDTRGRTAVRGLIRDARAQSGIVVVSHDAEEFLGEADRALVLVDGRTAFIDSAAQLVAHPEVFVAAGLIAPDVLRVQQLALERGCDPGPFTMDPRTAAANIARAGGWA